MVALAVSTRHAYRPSLQMALGCPNVDLSPVPTFWLRLSHSAITSMMPCIWMQHLNILRGAVYDDDGFV